MIVNSGRQTKPIKNNLRQVILPRAVRFLAGGEAALPQGHSKDCYLRKMTVCDVLYIAGMVENCTLWGKRCLDLVNEYRWETQPTCEYLSLMVQELISAVEELKPRQSGTHTHTWLFAQVLQRSVSLTLRWLHNMPMLLFFLLFNCNMSFDLKGLNQNAAFY